MRRVYIAQLRYILVYQIQRIRIQLQRILILLLDLGRVQDAADADEHVVEGLFILNEWFFKI